MKQKKLMLLGGIRYLLPVIETAHRLGARVITADYLPGNIAHKYSDEYANASIIDRESVLNAASKRQIDGILSFGVDPGVVTAAYVADKMGLPSPPFKSVEILQNKDMFRDFLEANGFNCPWHRGYSSKVEALADFKPGRRIDGIRCDFPVIVKPVDSAGSKGCVRVDSFETLEMAIDGAMAESHSGRFIIEQFLEKACPTSDTDGFSIDGKLTYCSFNCQHFDSMAPNPHTPAGYTWPGGIPQALQDELRKEIQRLIGLLDLGTSIYNIETRVATDGKAYIMELSPRGGGNRLSEVLKLATGQDLIENCVRAALGMDPIPMCDPKYDGSWAELIIHSNQSGKFVSLDVDCGILDKNVVQTDLWVKPGDAVSEFSGANQAIGTMILKFASHEEAEERICHSDEWCKVAVHA